MPDQKAVERPFEISEALKTKFCQQAYLPLELRLRGKSTTQSCRTPIYFADLTLQEGRTLADAVKEARARAAQLKEAGVDQGALDRLAQAGYDNAAFEESDEEVGDIMDEFYPGAASEVAASPVAVQRLSLAERLDKKQAIG